jgi:hypothetical protein
LASPADSGWNCLHSPFSKGQGMTGPLILIVLGVLFLLNNLYPEVYPFSRVWPLLLVVIGIGKVLESIAHRGGRNKPPSGKESE